MVAPASNRSVCLQFDKDVSNIIQATAKGDADSRLQTMTTIIISYASERFRQVAKEQPVKILGKLFHASLKDSAAIQKSNDKLGAWLTKVDKSGLPDRFKAWIYQHSILPRVLWPLLVYEVPLTTVESLERKISSFLRKWLGFTQSLTSTALYGTSNILQVPFSVLIEEFKVARTKGPTVQGLQRL
ncbi:hypothetical protein P4O66_002996 [Electrophorus voltai]|uniref:Uncharacterized protein n=1 Tax=Electrophorus voltai TaxID=2609070 RepID=A0AAD9DMQ4_9TELE|nr:hypothetical protein P4O66_002996 [Electrophorus voltai]